MQVRHFLLGVIVTIQHNVLCNLNLNQTHLIVYYYGLRLRISPLQDELSCHFLIQSLIMFD